MKYNPGHTSRIQLSDTTCKVLISVVLTMCVSEVFAVTRTGSMTVTAIVPATCTAGVSTLAFGSITSTAIQSANIDRDGVVSVKCTNGHPYTISLDAGTAVGASIAIRKMSAGSARLNYSIYTTAARTSIWGNGTSGSVAIPGTGSGLFQTIIAYGRIYSGQTVPAAGYTDTVVVTVAY